MLPLLLSALFWLGPVMHTPQTPDGLLKLAIKASGRSEHRKAISLYSEAIKGGLDPAFTYQALNNRGTEYFDLESYDKALADFSVAYADQSERDHGELVKAAQAGKIEVFIEGE